MKTNSLKQGTVGVQVVVGVVAVGAIIVAVAALQQSSSAKKGLQELRGKLDNESALSSQLESDVRQLQSRSQSAFSALTAEVLAMKDQLAKKPEPPPVRQGGGDRGGPKAGGDEAAQPTGPGSYHAVKAGDTLGKMAKQYGTSVEAIEKLNPSLNPARLKVGQKIRVK